jgi:hypothetical protein
MTTNSSRARPLPCQRTRANGQSLNSMQASNSTTCTIPLVSSSLSPPPRGADHPQDFKPFSLSFWFTSLIATFPSQLLGEIFQHILFNLDGTPVKDIEVKRVMLRSVCRHWMHAVDSNPFLWRALVLDHFDLWYKNYKIPWDLVERFVRYSGEGPICISINASLERHPHYCRQYAGLVMRGILAMLVGPQGDVLKRWNSFKFSCCGAFDVSLLGSLSLWPAPLLTGVEVNCPGLYGGIIELNAPMLRRIVHRECSLFFAPHQGFPFMALSDLTLWAPPDVFVDLPEWLKILHETPRLICLCLRDTFQVDVLLPGPLEKDEIVELPYLQQIVINEPGPWKLLQYLRFPTLATLKVDGALSDTFCDRLIQSQQCWDHLSHIKRLWFREGIVSATWSTVEPGKTVYLEFLARLFPELDTLVVPFSIYRYSYKEASYYKKVWPEDERWRVRVFRRLQDDTRFPHRAVINGGETGLKACFENLHDAPSGDLEAHRDLCFKHRSY